jgi:hypothetical protein
MDLGREQCEEAAVARECALALVKRAWAAQLRARGLRRCSESLAVEARLLCDQNELERPHGSCGRLPDLDLGLFSELAGLADQSARLGSEKRGPLRRLG